MYKPDVQLIRSSVAETETQAKPATLAQFSLRFDVFGLLTVSYKHSS